MLNPAEKAPPPPPFSTIIGGYWKATFTSPQWLALESIFFYSFFNKCSGECPDAPLNVFASVTFVLKKSFISSVILIFNLWKLAFRNDSILFCSSQTHSFSRFQTAVFPPSRGRRARRWRCTGCSAPGSSGRWRWRLRTPGPAEEKRISFELDKL